MTERADAGENVLDDQETFERLTAHLPRPIGDGITDETETIQAWADAGFLPGPGRYLITRTIELIWVLPRTGGPTSD